jgi:hypothetical protein
MDFNEPSSWTAPRWHPDFGDPEQELQLLRKFAQRLRERTECLVQLRFVEEGYMTVDLYERGNERFGTVCVTTRDRDATSRSFALFIDRDTREYYFREVEDGIARICEFLGTDPKQRGMRRKGGEAEGDSAT